MIYGCSQPRELWFIDFNHVPAYMYRYKCTSTCAVFDHSVYRFTNTPLLLTQFQTAVSKLGNSFMLLCPGVMPLRHFVHREAQTCGLQLDPYFYQYVDINTEFSRGFPDTQRPTTLEEMCACILLVCPFGLYFHCSYTFVHLYMYTHPV